MWPRWGRGGRHGFRSKGIRIDQDLREETQEMEHGFDGQPNLSKVGELNVQTE